MRTRMTAAIHAALAAALVAAGATMSFAQVIGPGGVLIAPGPSQPNYTPGGVGPGGTLVAPGPAGRDITIEQPGPGGIRMVPGPAGSIAAQRRAPPESPVLYGSEAVRGTIISDRDAGHQRRFRHRPGRIKRHRHVTR
jgi:hypothetical protein